jgi:hypothetical protein
VLLLFQLVAVLLSNALDALRLTASDVLSAAAVPDPVASAPPIVSRNSNINEQEIGRRFICTQRGRTGGTITVIANTTPVGWSPPPR